MTQREAAYIEEISRLEGERDSLRRKLEELQSGASCFHLTVRVEGLDELAKGLREVGRAIRENTYHQYGSVHVE